jgi:hypothetical protein
MTAWRSIGHVNNELMEILAAVEGLCHAAKIIQVTDGEPTAWTLDPREVLRVLYIKPKGRGTVDLQLPEPKEEPDQ